MNIFPGGDSKGKAKNQSSRHAPSKPTPTPAPMLTNALEQLREAVEAMMEENK